MDFTITLLICLFLLTIYGYLKKSYPKNYPPGPWSVPLLGSLPFIGNPTSENLVKLSKKYGDIFSLQIGETDCVVVNGWNNMAEVQKREDFVEFPNLNGFQLFSRYEINGSKLGLISGDIDNWKPARDFLLKFMKRDEFNGKKMEDYINNAVDKICPNLEGKVSGKKLIDNLHFVYLKLAHDYFVAENFFTESQIKIVSEKVREIIKCDVQCGTYYVMPFITHLMDRFFGKDMLGPLRIPYNELLNMIDTRIAEVKKDEEFMKGDSCLANYLRKLETIRGTKEEKYFDENNLSVTIFGLCFAAGLSASTICHWLLIYLPNHPDHLERVRTEIKDAFGGQPPSMEGKSRTPFLESFINEVMRNQPLVPIAMRAPCYDTTLNGFTIPKGTTIVLNLWETMKSERYWKNPNQFNPERFLDEEQREKFLKRSMTFGFGKRRCLAENIGKMEIYLTIVKILQTYNLRTEGVKIERSSEGDSLSFPSDGHFHFIKRADK